MSQKLPLNLQDPDKNLPISSGRGKVEAGLDEAGRGCLAGPVVAAAVILPPDFSLPGVNDSKKLTHRRRMELRPLIIEHSLAWGVGMISAARIDEVNILNASFEAMHQAVDELALTPDLLAIDGNRFTPYPGIAHQCFVKGDTRFQHIAAASILAKTFRDEAMYLLDQDFPMYHWTSNKGYPTKQHKIAIRDHGPSPYHRTSFRWSLEVDSQ